MHRGPKQTDGRRLKEISDVPIFPRANAITRAQNLSVTGRVRFPRVFTLEELMRLPKVSLTEDFRCLEGWVVREVLWEGVSVASILRLAGLMKDARWVLFGSGEFTAVVDRETALRNNTILAMRKVGRKLTQAHGGPVRLVFESHQCYESVKSTDRIVALAEYTDGTARAIATSRIRV